MNGAAPLGGLDAADFQDGFTGAFQLIGNGIGLFSFNDHRLRS